MMSRLKLYLCRGLSAWGDRLWTFGAGIFMAKLNEENFRLVAIYGLTLCLTVVLFGALIGNWIDRTERLVAALTFLCIQNLGTAVASGLLATNLYANVVPYIVIAIASVTNLASVGSKIIIEKDWIVVVADGNQEQLSSLNAIFRTIDLCCLVLAPLGVGVLFEFTSDRITAISIGIWNVVSFIFEFGLLWKILKEYPALSNKNSEAELKMCNPLRSWKGFFNHPVKFAGVALSLLYLTVLGFDNVTWAYCHGLKVSELVLGASVGVSAIMGVLGSLMFPCLCKKIGLRLSGIFGISFLIMALIPSVISIWLPGSPFDPHYFVSQESTEQEQSYWSVGTFLTGIICARFGLWIFDLSVSQIFQEEIEESLRGSYNGVQSSLNNIMDIIKFVFVITLPAKETFGWAILFSFSSILMGGVFYLVFYTKSCKMNTSK